MDGVTPDNVRDGKIKELTGHQEIKYHMIFDVKMDFTWKARFVARGDLTTATPNVTYSSVISRDSVQLAFLITGLNDLDIVACDISNAHLNAPCRVKIWFQGGKDTGEDAGKVLIVDRVLHGLRFSGASWTNMLSKTLQEDFGFEATRADPEVHRRPACHNGFKHYECIFVHVDNLLILLKELMNWTKKLGAVYDLKEDSVGPPDTYLGAQIGKTQQPNGFTA